MYNLGDLVSSSAFDGVGKVVAVFEIERKLRIAFFESPHRPEARPIDLDFTLVEPTSLFDERVVYCLHPMHKNWARARYGGEYEDGTHLVIFRQEETATVPISEIYVPNMPEGTFPDPSEYLSARTNDTPRFTEWRLPFLRAYIRQRAACRSISSIPSSSVELEPHQLAVVRRILQDPVKRYLLGDEVGLGKTVEAGLVIREHILEQGANARVAITCPNGLIPQWQEELTKKFHLGKYLVENGTTEPILQIRAFESFANALTLPKHLTMMVVDEAHQISPLAWEDEFSKNQVFNAIADACHEAESCLLLSGTPLLGNEKNYLAMLNCLSPMAFSLDQAGVDRFTKLTQNREALGGIYSALVVDNDDETLVEIADEIRNLVSDDEDLARLLTSLKKKLQSVRTARGERKRAIEAVRSYIGNHFRIFHRLLRNRRVDPSVAVLFPGLAGLSTVRWRDNSSERGLDDMLDEYRDFHQSDPNTYSKFGEYLGWLDLYFESPGSVQLHAEKLLSSSEVSDAETEILDHLVSAAAEEELTKRRHLIDSVREWLNAEAEGKVVVFCGSHGLAKQIYCSLLENLPFRVELHEPSQQVQFNDQVETRVLVCDHRGEDGLNLHGKVRLAVHYGMPRSLARIEQRNGRLNRYAAQVRGARPVEVLTLTPAYGGIYSDWVRLLDRAVGLFDDTVASLQFVLEEHFSEVWRQIASGSSYQPVLRQSEEELTGPGKKLELEKNRIRNLEQLNSLEAEVEDANTFASEIVAQDEIAAEQAKPILKWMTDGLGFRQRGATDQVFTLEFNYNAQGRRTLIDIPSFLVHCLEGMDLENSDYHSPRTHPMSADRLLATEIGHVYPFRFGQPFVDTVYRFSLQDPRGISSVRLRFNYNSKEQELGLFFRLQWLVEAVSPSEPRWLQRIGDEWQRPAFKTYWLDEFCQPADDITKRILRAPYNPDKGGQYRDENIRGERWQYVGEWTDDERWAKTVNSVVAKSREQFNEEIGLAWTDRPSNLPGKPHVQLVSIEAFFLASPAWVSKVMQENKGVQ